MDDSEVSTANKETYDDSNAESLRKKISKAVDAGKGVDGGIGESEVIITFSSVEGPHAVNNNMVRTINLLM